MYAPFLLPPGLRLVQELSNHSGRRQWLLITVNRSARCPFCHGTSRRIHSRYQRTLADLPCGGDTICLCVNVRRFFCGNPLCRRKTFAEPLVDFARRYARRSERLRQAQTCVGQFVGSRPGVRLAHPLAIPTSATTLLRLERDAPLPVRATPRVLGVDDWAFKKGHHYGTILFDLEQHQVVDLLPDRTPETLAAWLQAHPGVEIVSRDRAEAYASGIRQGAPNALQVADRWHFVKNLGQALEHLLEGKRALLKQITAPDPATGVGANAGSDESEKASQSPHSRQARLEEQQKQCRRAYRVERYQTVQALHHRGFNISAIATQLHLSRRTVRKLVQAEQFPERKERAPRPVKLDAHTPYLRDRWKAGCHNAAVLFEEIRSRGYTGSYTQVKAWIHQLREQTPDEVVLPHDKLSPRQMAVWMLRRAEERTPRQQALLSRLKELSNVFHAATVLTDRFLAMVRQQPRQEQSVSLQDWLTEVLASDIAELRAYAKSVQQDFDAVCAGLSLPWSNGPVEGSVNRLKFVKRRGYGRANFDLLRRRVLQPT